MMSIESLSSNLPANPYTALYDVEIIQDTEKALLMYFRDKQKIWFPRSVVDDGYFLYKSKGVRVSVSIETRFIRENNLVFLEHHLKPPEHKPTDIAIQIPPDKVEPVPHQNTEVIMQLTPNQEQAVNVSTTSRRAIITGGAGSGKTFTIKAIVERLDPSENTVLCCPTGKAASRIRESTGYAAQTLHSACGIFPVDGATSDDELGQSLNTPKAATATTLIIDEASMLDDRLLSTALNRIPRTCRVILVGDPNQLPPVGAGYPFRDLIQSKRLPHVHLDKVHRQAGELLENCYQILNGDTTGLIHDAGKGNRKTAPWGFIETGDSDIANHLAKLFSRDTCEDVFGIPAEELLVLTPINKGDCGRVNLNRVIQQAYHSSRGRVAPKYKNDSDTEKDQFVVKDRVIWTVNDSGIGLVNGDTGTVCEASPKDVVVDWDGIGRKTVPQNTHLQLAWSLTCHKAQGSQYRKVLVIQASKHCNNYLNQIINRSWLYTACTRSKEATWFMGNAAAFEKHVQTPAIDSRRTVLETLIGVNA